MVMMGISNIYVLLDEFPDYQETGSLMPADSFEHDEEDVKAALERETKDGSGFESEDELPESDFDSFSEDNVENDHDGDNAGEEDGQ
jgi:hypothetical protein